MADAYIALDGETDGTATSAAFTPRRMGAGDPWEAWGPVQIDASAAATVLLEGRAGAGFAWATLQTFTFAEAGSAVEAVLRMPENRFRITANSGAVSAAAVGAEEIVA